MIKMHSGFEDRVNDIIKDIDVMIDYCASSNKFTIDNSVVKDYSAYCKNVFSDSKTLFEDYANLILIYDKLSRAISPVTPDTIRTTLEYEKYHGKNDDRRKNRARQALRSQKILLGIVSFLSLMLILFVEFAPFCGFFSGDNICVGYCDFSKIIFKEIGLPMGFGAIGSCIYSIRAIYMRIREYSLKISDASYYYVRSFIGSLLSVFVLDLMGRLANADLNFGVMIISFLSGYGVEIVYGALDTLVIRLRDVVTGNRVTGPAPSIDVK